MCWRGLIHVIPYCHMVIVIKGLCVHSYQGLHLGSGFLWTWLLVSRLWLSYCTIVFVRLMKLLSYMQWWINVQWACHWQVKVVFIYNKSLYNSWFILCICSGGIYHIRIEKLSTDKISPFSSMSLVHIHLVFFIIFLYIGGLISK